MIGYVKLALCALLCFVVLAVDAAGNRKLMDWDSCNRGYNSWRDGGWHGDYYCDGHRYDHDGGYYDGYGHHYGYGDRGGFSINVGR